MSDHLEIGLHNIPAARYHADPCPEPSLSSSLIRTLIDKSPLHAWQKHPRLNPAYKPYHADKFDLGNAAHALMLGAGNKIRVLEFKDWRTNAAKDARQAAYDAGETPMLAEHAAETRVMVEAGMRQLAAHRDAEMLLDPTAVAEHTLIWREGETWCRALPDKLIANRRVQLDYKTTEMSANPERWAASTLFSMGYDIQDAWYMRGAKAVLSPREWDFRFIVQEVYPPYALSVIGVVPGILEIANQKIEEALSIWRQCMKTNTWPGYPPFTHYVELPPWLATQWEQRKATKAFLADFAAEGIGA